MATDVSEPAPSPETNDEQPRAPAPPGPIGIAAFARYLGVTRHAVSLRVDAKRFTRAAISKRKGKWVVLDVELAAREWEDGGRPYAGVRVGDTNGHAPGSARYVSPLTAMAIREREARAIAQERENEAKAGRLIDRDEAERRETARIKIAQTKLLGIPSRARQRIPHLTAADTLVLEELIREALEELGDGRV